MKHALTLSQRYASSLLSLLSKEKEIDGALQDLNDYQASLESSEDLREVLASPRITHDQKVSLQRALLEKMKIKGNLANFLLLVLEHGRIGLLPKIIKEFRLEADEKLSRGTAFIHSAQELDEEQKKELTANLSAKLGIKLEAEFDVDSTLVGGFTVEIGNQVLDYSVKGQLERLDSLVTKMKVR